MNIGEKLDSMLRDLTEIRAWQTRHDAMHEAVNRDLMELRNETYGNGHPGLKSQVQSHQELLANLLRPRPGVDMLTKIGVNVVSGGLLMFFVWLLLIYKNVT